MASNAEKAKKVRAELEAALQEFGDMARKFGALPDRFENFAVSMLDEADEFAARTRMQESEGRRQSDAFAQTLGTHWAEDIEEYEGKLAAERSARTAAEQKLADLEARQATAAATAAQPATAQPSALEQLPAPVREALTYDGQILRDGADMLHTIKLVPRGGGPQYRVTLHRDVGHNLRSFTLTPEPMMAH